MNDKFNKSWFIINGFFALMTILGFFYGFGWAKTISIGIGWFFSIVSLIFFSDTVRYETIKKQRPMVNHMLDLLFDICIVSVFYYSGYFYLSVFYTVHILILLQYRSDFKFYKKYGYFNTKKRTKNEKTNNR